MYEVLCNKLVYSRRTYIMGSTLTKEIPPKILKDLEKAGKIKRVETKSTKK